MWILSDVKILKDLDSNELNSLELLCQQRFIKAWELLFKQWDEANSMYLLSKWKIEVFTEKDWEEIILGHIEAEDILWEMALFWERAKRMASARAVEDSILIVMLDFAIKDLANNHPEILEKIKKVIEDRNNHNKELL